MKIYTEEEVRKAIELTIEFYGSELSRNDILAKLTPIELPSDEHIENMNNYISKGWSSNSFENGAKWVIKLIKQQDGRE